MWRAASPLPPSAQQCPRPHPSTAPICSSWTLAGHTSMDQICSQSATNVLREQIEPVDILYHHLGGKFVGSDRRIIRGYRRTPIITTRYSQNVLPGVFSRHEVADTQPEDLQQLCLPKLRQTVPR